MNPFISTIEQTVGKDKYFETYRATDIKLITLIYCQKIFIYKTLIMKKALILLIGLSYTTFIFISCSKEGGGGGSSVDCSTVTNKAFAADVNPIIQGRCNISGCHAAGSTNGPGALTNYTEVFNSRSAIRSAVSTGRMPQGSTLSTAQKNSIICWIDGGAPNN